jgi:hypothetical protein
VHDFDELLSRAARRIFAGFRIDQVIPNVVFEHYSKQAIQPVSSIGGCCGTVRRHTLRVGFRSFLLYLIGWLI